MKKIILAAVAATLVSSAANAQNISFGPEIGLNLSSLTGKTAGKSDNSSILPGARIGAVADIGVTEHIFVRPGIQFSMMGGKDDVAGVEVKTMINYIHVPVNVLYKLGEEGESRIYFGIVPYFGYAVSGKQKIGDNSTDLKIGTKEHEDNLKPMDFGAGVKVGYEFPMGLCVDAAFLQGLTNLVPGGDADNKTNTRN